MYVHQDLEDLTQVLLRAAARNQNLNGLLAVALDRAARERRGLGRLLGFWDGALGSQHLTALRDDARGYGEGAQRLARDHVQAGVQLRRGRWTTVPELIETLGMPESEVRRQLDDLLRLRWVERSTRGAERYRGWPADDW